MNTKDSMVLGNYTEASIKRLKDYLLSTPSNDARIELKGDMLFVEFNNDSRPAQEIITMARQIFYWTDALTVPHIDSFVHYYTATNTMLINLVHYEEISKI